MNESYQAYMTLALASPSGGLGSAAGSKGGVNQFEALKSAANSSASAVSSGEPSAASPSPETLAL